MFQPTTLSNIAMNTEAFPRTRNRPMPVTRFRRLFVDSIPLRLRYFALKSAFF